MAVQSVTRQIVMSDLFLKAYDALPVSARRSIRERLEILRNNPSHPSLNYETIANAGDSRMRSIRASIHHRIILAHPDGSGTYILLWVDNHDAAYAWAVRHRLDIGDDRRGLAIVTVDERTDAPHALQESALTKDSSILRDCSDEQLLAVGVPQALLPALRGCQNEDDLLVLLGALRPEVSEPVLRLAVGDTLPLVTSDDDGEQIVSAPQPERAQPVEDPVVAALQRPESGRRFVVLSSQQELEQALNYPMERWRLFLHPDQRTIVTRHYTGPALVSGGAGTGKTVVGLHRARYLASTVFPAPEDRVLVTTFTHNLAANLSRLMDSLCGDDHDLRERIEVVSVHSLATKIRRQARESFGIIQSDAATRLMMEAMEGRDTLGLPLSFYQAEWREVALEREALTEATYLEVDRSGRGKALNRRQRAAIWPVLEAYRDALTTAKREEWPLVVHRARELVESGSVTFPYRYRAAIVDEAQDMGAPEMRLLLALVGVGPDSVLLLGDSRQQIYARGSFVRLLNLPIGRRHARLRVNYRTTEQIRAMAARALTAAEALTGEPLPPDDSISLLSGPHPIIRTFTTEDQEVAAVIEAVRDALTTMAPEEIAVVARTGKLVTSYLHALTTANIQASKLDAERTTLPGVQVGTMHRVKGLEFRGVFLVGCSADVLPQPYTGEDEEAAHADHEERERHLLYVAMTRAREVLWISSADAPSPLLSHLTPSTA